MKQDNENNQTVVSADWGAACMTIGIVLLIVAAICVAATWIGAYSLSGNGTGEAGEIETMMSSLFFAGLVVPLAALGLLLTVIGIVFRKPGGTQRKFGEISCPNCGRKNATTTKVCPRCMTRLDNAK